MRAILSLDANKGPGHALLHFMDIPDPGAPAPFIRRLYDGQYLVQGGWRSEPDSFTPDVWKYQDGALTIWVGPSIVDNIDPRQRYEAGLPGHGAALLVCENVIQSNIIDINGNDVWPQLPNQDFPTARQALPEADIYEGVEATPSPVPFGKDEGGGPKGVVSEPYPRGSRRHGCMILAFLLFMVWLAGAWFLWQKTLRAPASEDDDYSPFEFIPGSEESAGDNVSQDDKKAQN